MQDMINEAVNAERERCAKLCLMLAGIHRASAERARKDHTFVTRAIWPPFKKVTFVMPNWERQAKALEAAAHGHEVVAECIRNDYDPDAVKPDDKAKICSCHKRMGNEFWFLPTGQCLSEGPCDEARSKTI